MKLSGCWSNPQHLLPPATPTCSVTQHKAFATRPPLSTRRSSLSLVSTETRLFHTQVLCSRLLIKEQTTTGTLRKTRGSQRPDSSGFKGYKSVEGPAICRRPLLPPGPAPPTLSPDTQEIKVSQLVLCLPLTQQHYLSPALQRISQHFSREKSGGGCVPSPVCQYTGATLVCQGSSTVWNTTLNSDWACLLLFLNHFFSQPQKNNVLYTYI